MSKKPPQSTPNPFLKCIAAADLPANMRAAWNKSIELRGDATFFEVFGNNPSLYQWYVDRFYKELFYAKGIDQQLKELLRFRLSTLHGCKFCNQGNRLEALNAGLSEAQIDHIENYEEGPFSAKEKVVLRLADQVTLTNENGSLTKTLYEELSKFYTDGTILELGMIMGILTGIAKFLFVFDLVAKEENCPFQNH